MVRTPFKTMKGLSFHPSAMVPRQTVRRAFTCLVVLSSTDLAPTRSTLVSPGISTQRGVSSIFPIADSGIFSQSRSRWMCTTNPTTLGNIYEIVNAWRLRNFSGHPWLAVNIWLASPFASSRAHSTRSLYSEWQSK